MPYFLVVSSNCLLIMLVQEWPEEDYPPYANGPGYILSSDVAYFIVSEFEKHKLRVSQSFLLPPPIPQKRLDPTCFALHSALVEAVV